MKHLLVPAITATALALVSPAYAGPGTDAAPAEGALLKEACETTAKAAPTAGAKADLYDYRVTVTVSPAVSLIVQDTAFDGPDWRKTLDCKGERAMATRISRGKVEVIFQALVRHPAQKEPRYIAFTDSFALKDLKGGTVTRQKDGTTYTFALKTV